MSLGTALALAFLAGFAYFSRRFMGDLFLERPIVLAPLTGLIMGDLHTGLVVGGTLELVFMGAADIGGSVPPNYTIGSILGAAFAIHSGQGLGTALLVAIPAALLGSFFELLAKTVSVFFVNAADRYAERGDDRAIAWLLHLGNAVHFLADAVPTFFALWLGIDAVKALTASIPAWLQHGINTAGAVLPALGFALLLNSLVTPALFPLFFIGFLLAVYTKFNVLGVALLVAMVVVVLERQRAQAEPAEAEAAAALAGAQGAPSGGATRLPAGEIRRIFWRSFAIQSAFSFDRMQAMGFTWTLMPLLRRLYGDRPAEFRAALKRHLAFFNTHPWLTGPIFALTADLEARRARGEAVDDAGIQGLKAGLMGPLAGIGDSMFHGTLRPLMGGVSAALALQGNPVAPFLFFVTVNAVHVLVQWYSLDAGYRLGDRAVALLAAGGQRLMQGAAMVGLATVGALTATWLNVATPLTYHVQKASVSVQQMLDGILPKLLPLAVVLLVFWIVRKRVNTTWVMLGMMAAGLVLGAVGVLG